MMQEAPENTPTSSPAKAPVRLIIAGLLLGSLMLGGAWLWRAAQLAQPPHAAPPQSAALQLPPPMPEREITAPVANALAQASMRLDSLEAQLEQLKTAAAGQPPAMAGGGAVTQLEQSVHAISANLDAITTTVTALHARLAALEAVQAAQPHGSEAKRMTYALALRELEHALSGSGPFALELESLAKLPGTPDLPLAQLRPHAATGIPTRAALMARFDAAAAQIVRSDAIAGVAPGWAGRVYAFVQSLIMVRPLGEREGTDAPSSVARAQMRLEAGDLDAAVLELGVLQGAAAEAGAAWLQDARARLTAGQALASLTAELTRQLNDDGAAQLPPALQQPAPVGE